MDGYGELKSENGDVYYGQFKDGKKNGYGKVVKKNGTEKNGRWNNGMYLGFL